MLIDDFFDFPILFLKKKKIKKVVWTIVSRNEMTREMLSVESRKKDMSEDMGKNDREVRNK